MKKFYAFTAEDLEHRRFSATHYQVVAADWAEFVLEGHPDPETASSDQFNASKFYAIARVKMGLVEKDYDFG